MPNILITGTSKGIGLETALTLARAGHIVYATMRNPAAYPELAQRAAHENLPIHISAMDVDNDTSVQSAIARIQKEAGQIDVLVNNAGIERNGAIEELPLAEIRAVMETNYFGAIKCIQAVLPPMRQRHSGVIINISSVAGKVSTSPLGPYAASKFALEAITEALAQEVKPFNIRVAIVEPGIINTPMARSIEVIDPIGPYSRQARRFAHMFAATLQTNPTPPSLVAEKILEIIATGTWQFRHPVGDAAATFAWRASMSDENYIALNAADDETWYASLNPRVRNILSQKK